MLQSISLHNFKNHLERSLSFAEGNIIFWPNWAWKTNIIEAIYFLINWNSFWQLNNSQVLNYENENFLISWSIKDDWIWKELKITYLKEWNRLNFFYNNSKVTRPKYSTSTDRIAIFFSPMEMNIMYLWPSLRRDFLDEVSMLDSPSFHRIKSDYSKILKNRNRLLKEIKENNASKDDLKFWNRNFILKSKEYYSIRMPFIEYIKDNMSIISQLLENKYELSLEYETKVDNSNIEQSIERYLEINEQRDIITWHTYIWPHLDDIIFKARWWKELHPVSEMLSRWENKSILIALKFLEIEYFRKKHDFDIILLLDDIFSELDDHHVDLVLDYAKKYQTFITTQNIPWFLLENTDFKLIEIK